MKNLFQILQHPALLTFTFLVILISGENFGGFYALYVLMALFHGSLHAIAALAGILLVFLAPRINNKNTSAVLSIAGAACMVLSIILFFMGDKEGYNAGTFRQIIPLFTIIIFSLISIAFTTGKLLRITRQAIHQ